MWLSSRTPHQLTTGFTRVLARPPGVFSQPRNAATKSFAAESHGAIPSLPALSRGRATLAGETVVRSDRASQSGCRTDFEEPLSLITETWKLTSNRRCLALGAVDQSPCSTSTTPLIALDRSPDNRPPRSNRRTPLLASRSRWKADFVTRGQQLDSARDRTPLAATSPLVDARAIALREPSSFRDGRARPSSASEQVWTSRTVSSISTRNTQRVPDEEGNARQCAAARREPHRHC